MEHKNRPVGREKHVTEGGGNVHRRGDGVHGSGPVGKQDGYAGREEDKEGRGLASNVAEELLENALGGKGNSAVTNVVEKAVENLVVNEVEQHLAQGMHGGNGNGSGLGSLLSGGSGGRKRSLGCGTLILIVLVIGIGIFFFSSMFGGGGGTGISSSHSLYANYGGGSTGSSGQVNNGVLNTEVSDQAREKRTLINGNGNDTVTVMVYMCAADLESKGGAATADLQEMLAATIGKNENVIVETGGTTKWQNNVVASDRNQIYQVQSQGLKKLEDNLGMKNMTDPATLSEFIRYCKQNFPANRYDLIFWDHGGGSISGYGYDLNFANSGSMTLDKIYTALKDGGCQFDFVGFDACLMATLETALMLEPYSDYLIASEETEPGSGWYYTDWLTNLSNDPSRSTLEIGKDIVDGFIEASQENQTTLSVMDLAEIKGTVPDAFTDFSKATLDLLKSDDYQVVSTARSNVKEFAKSVEIDQVDLINLADNMNTEESKNLAKVLRNCVKYNRTGSGMANSYGVSIYFPYAKPGKMSTMLSTYKKIGLDDSYSECISRFANLEVGGQIASGSTSSSQSLLTQLLGGGQSSSSSQGSISQDMIESLLSAALSGFGKSIPGMEEGDDTSWIDQDVIKDSASYYAENQLDSSKLKFEEKNGQSVLKLTEDQWNMIQNVELNVFLDDGEGYIDLGLDNAISFDDDGDMVADYDKTWIALNGQVVSYYFISETTDGDAYTIRGRVPVMLNGEYENLILEFTDENPYGVVLGAQTDYDGLTDVQAKGYIALQDGDKLDFLCDYYTYDGEFVDNYYLGEQMTVDGDFEISNVSIGDSPYKASYRVTDMYHNEYWTEMME